MTTLLERFEAKYEPITESGCWIWTANSDKDGYGQFRIGKKMMRPHRFSYEHFVGEIPNGMYVLHKCDIPSCVRPEHLFVGTQKDNVADMIKKGRDWNMQLERGASHCKRGHEFNEENTRWSKNKPKRHCRACDRMNAYEHYWRNK